MILNENRHFAETQSGRDLPLLFTDQCEKLGVAIEKGLEEYYPGYAE